MAKRWSIVGLRGDAVIFEAYAYAPAGRRQIESALACLQARHLTEKEVVDAATGKSAKLRVQPVALGDDLTLTTLGKPEYYTARYEDV
jgi:hypothetical protein